MRRTNATIALAALIAVSGSLTAANVIAIEDALAQGGARAIPVRILASTDQAVMGFSFAATYPAGLRLAEITLDGTSINDEVNGAEFFMPVAGNGYFGAAIIMDYEPPYDGRALGPCPGPQPRVVLR